MKLTLLYPEYLAAGGAEILAASHAQYLRDEGYDTRMLTFAYDAKRWDSWFEGIELSSMPPASLPNRVGDFLRTKLPRRVEWLRGQLTADRTLISYNYPASTALGLIDTPARRIWHCCEPSRTLHLFETNPVLTARAGATLGLAKEHVSRAYFRHMVAWRAQATFGVLLRRRRAVDLAAIANYPEIWAISEFTRDTVKAVYGRSDAQLLYPMVRFPDTAPHRSGLRRDGLGVLCHTRLETLKNVDTVLRGFQQFAATAAGRNAKLHVVGQGEMRPRLEKLAQELGIGGATTFHGFLSLPALERVYADCDVYALLPVDEPFGMVFPEAAARGLLLIGPDHGGPAEILEHGRYGWCVNAFAPEALAEALSAVTRLTDAEADRRRTEADGAVRARFSRGPIGHRLQQLLARS